MSDSRVVLAAILALVCGSGRVGALDAGEVVGRVQARYDQTADFTAHVRQEVVVVSAGKTLRSEGTVEFKRPGKMRWTLQNHERQIIVADGETLWFYQPDEQQALKAPFRFAFRSTTPISFLTGVGRIADDFAASVEGQDDRSIQLRLVPRQTDGDIGQLILNVNAASYDITGAETRDVFGNITRIAFDEVERNRGLSDSLFTFEVPPGVDVIQAPIGY